MGELRPGPVLVTGAARGLGSAIAMALAKMKVEPLLLGRDLISLAAISDGIAEITARPPRCVVADVADWKSTNCAIEEQMITGETLSGLINNAGIIGPIDLIEDSNPEAWAECISVNLLGPYHILRACISRLTAGGLVVNISSGAAEAEHVGWSAYSASKAALERLSATMAAERPDLRVLAVRPGLMNTDMQVEIKASRIENAVRRIPIETMQSVTLPAEAIAKMFTTPSWPCNARVIDVKCLY